MASGARSTPIFFSGLPSCLRIAPVPQPASRIAFWRQSGSSLSRFSKISRCSARYHQCVSSTRNMVAYSSGRIVPRLWRLACGHVGSLPSGRSLMDRWFLVGTSLHRAADHILRRAGVIEVKSPKIFTDKTENHQLNTCKEYNAREDGRNTDGPAWFNPNLVYKDGNQRQYA